MSGALDVLSSHKATAISGIQAFVEGLMSEDKKIPALKTLQVLRKACFQAGHQLHHWVVRDCCFWHLLPTMPSPKPKQAVLSDAQVLPCIAAHRGGGVFCNLV